MVTKDKKAQFKAMYFLKQRTIVINLIVMSLIWLTWSFNYFLLNFQMKYLPGNINVNMFVSFAAELLSYVVSGIFISRFSFKTNFVLFFTIN